tara:strand:+ start:892 stop:1137 length:246 start_codon:yes stop_codon:yes gene_type:complete
MSSQKGGDSQFSNGVKGVEVRQESPVADEVVDATFANNLGSVGSGMLQAGVAGEVAMEDVDIGTFAKLCRYLLLGRSLVAD